MERGVPSDDKPGLISRDAAADPGERDHGMATPDAARAKRAINDWLFRGAFGVSRYASSTQVMQQGGTESVDMTGAAMTVRMDALRRVTQGLFLGVSGYLQNAEEPGVRVNGGASRSTENFSVASGSVGVAAEYLLEQDRGLRGQVYAGYLVSRGVLELGDEEVSSEASTGWTLGAGVGYDFKLRGDFTIGPELRADFARTKYDGAVPENGTVFTPSLSVAIAWGTR